MRIPDRQGPAAARNAGIENSDTKYVAFLDSDDVWLPGKLAIQVSEMERKELDFTYLPYANVSRDRVSRMPVRDAIRRKELLGNTVIGCSTVMLRRDFIGDRRFADAPCEDLAFWAELLGGDGQAHLATDEVMVLRHAGGRSRNKFKAAFRYWRTLRRSMRLSLAETTRHFIPYAVHAMLKHWGPPNRRPVLPESDKIPA
ncbi:hypothetical protein ATO6_12185 [Oceanicola sp. 22II-s10i]|nr:hypothetical protein ATO6_12185 [Oceanicola sp. 22II-s10i]